MATGLIAGALAPKKKPFNLGLDDEDELQTPALRAVDPKTETVSGQMSTLLETESPYITRARAGAAGTANSRGLLNSSIAAGAGEAAAIDAALPIASQDASTYGTAARENQAARNQFGLTRETGRQTRLTQGQGGLIQSGLIGEQGTQTRLTQAQGGDITSRQIGEQGSQTRLTQEQQGQITARMAELQGQIQTGLIGAEGEQTRLTDAQRAAAQEELTRLQGDITSQLQGEQAQQAEHLAQLRGEIETGLQELRGNQAQGLAQIEADNRLLMQSSASASQFFTQTMESVSAILNNPDLSVEQRQAAVDHQLALLEAGLAVIGGAGNIDLGGLVDFEVVGNPPGTTPVEPPTPVSGPFPTEGVGPNGPVARPTQPGNGTGAWEWDSSTGAWQWYRDFRDPE